MTLKADSDTLHEIIKVIHSYAESEDDDAYDRMDELYNLVCDTKRYKSLSRDYKLQQQRLKIEDLKRKQKQAEKQAHELMIELQKLESEF